MSFTNEWTESAPTDESYGYEIDDYMRRERLDVRERLAVQHKAYSDETGHTDVGEHKPGECNIAFIGAKASFPTPSSSNAGCLGIATDEGNQLYYWSGSVWTKVQEPMLITGDQTITGAKTFANILASADLDIGSYKLKAQQLESDIVTGTAPLIVASATKVDNLNADTIDGFHVEVYDNEESYLFPGGMIFKQGTVAVAGNTIGTVNFATPFPSAVKTASVCVIRNVDSSVPAPHLYALTSNSISFRNNDGVSNVVHWQVWGK